ncbi:ATP-binding protein [Salibacter halophilus]|uniref:histidine kinase n=1 Tax=Salibacter halophilus TaxID=1803916 RepID=A0A6N6M5U5_9FLAO|nr:sensor histidine kinase [Salibacter halophilus]KAB1063193.1 tetratricopeptide repeat protein [Salibacter halophilus]
MLFKYQNIAVLFWALVPILLFGQNRSQLTEQLKQASSGSDRIAILSKIGQLHYEKGNTDSVYHYAELISKTDQGLEAFVNSQYLKAYGKTLEKDREEVFFLLDKVQKATRDKNDSLWAQTLYKRAYFNYQFNDFISVSKDLRLSMKLADSLDLVSQQVASHILKASMLVKIGELNDALETAKEAEKINAILNDKANEATIDKLLGNCYYHLGKYEQSLQAYFRSARYYENKKYMLEAANIYSNIGTIYQSLKKLDQAESYTLRAKKIYAENGYNTKVANSYVNLGGMFTKTEPERALDYFNSAKKVFEKNADSAGLAKAFNNIANVYYYETKYKEALEFFKKSLAINNSLNDQKEVSRLQTNLGYTYMMLNNKTEAEKYFKSGLSTARKIDGLAEITASMEGFSDMHAHFNEYEKALEYKDRYIAFKDSMLNVRMSEKIAELRTRYETEQKESEIKSLNREREIDQLKLSQQKMELEQSRNQIIYLIIFILLSFFVLYGAYKRISMKREREFQKAIIHEQKEGLEAVISALENERKRISRDLHDGVAQTLTGLKMSFERFYDTLHFQNQTQRKRFSQSIEYLNEACDEVRTISHEMMPKGLQQFGLITALQDILSNMFNNSNMSFTFDFYGMKSQDRLPEMVELSAYRIVQELLNNIVKHSGANKIDINLYRNEKDLVITVEDDGKGFLPDIEKDAKKGKGLLNIRSRANSLNGDVGFEPGATKGTIATLTLPLKGDANDQNHTG